MASLTLSLLRERYDALLIGNGAPPSKKLLSSLRPRCEHLIALDGGLNVLARHAILPEHVVGDLDSVTPAAVAWAKSGGAKIHYRPSVDEPDFLKGLTLCRKLKCRSVLATGIAGARLDHVLGALYFALDVRGLEIELVTDEVMALPLRGRIHRSLEIPEGHSLSWFAAPQAGPCSLSGVKWPFRNRILRPQGFYSLSNQPTEPMVELFQNAGRSIFIISLTPQNKL